MFCMVGKAWGHCFLQARQQIPGLAEPFKVLLPTGCPESTCEVATIDDVADLAVRESITFIIIHWTRYLFSDWPKAYSEFSKSAPVT